MYRRDIYSRICQWFPCWLGYSKFIFFTWFLSSILDHFQDDSIKGLKYNIKKLNYLECTIAGFHVRHQKNIHRYQNRRHQCHSQADDGCQGCAQFTVIFTHEVADVKTRKQERQLKCQESSILSFIFFFTYATSVMHRHNARNICCWASLTQIIHFLI